MINKYQNTQTNNIIVAEQSFIDSLSDSQDYVNLGGANPTLEELKAESLRQVIDKSNANYNTFVGKYPSVEGKSFEKKAEEAYRVSADNSIPLAETRYLTDLTGGIDNSTIELRNALADAVNEKTFMMAQLETWGVLKRDEINSCTTIEALEAIVI